jgi:uncharacterized protein (TIGR01777 family)
MNIVVTGSSGMIGSALCCSLSKDGHNIIRMVRTSTPGPEFAFWDPTAGVVDRQAIDGVDAVVHLAAENVAARRWNEHRKSVIASSRVNATSLLAQTLAELRNPPSVFISASAVAFYGDRGQFSLTEDCPVGAGFSAELCQAWEAATEPAERAGIRVAHLRTGIALDINAGALKRFAPVFRLGLGGRIGSGEQYMSWISLIDEIRAISHIVLTPTISGPVNLTGPCPVTNMRFTQALSSLVKRPAVMPAPASILRAALGKEMANELLLVSQRAVPEKLLSHGFSFLHSNVEDALSHALGGGGSTRSLGAAETGEDR